MIRAFVYLFLLTVLFDIVLSHIPKFNRYEFDKLVDRENFVIILICSSEADQSCTKERDKLNTLSKDMSSYKDVVFGYINKDSDYIMMARCDVYSFPTIKLFPYNSPSQNYVFNIRIADLKAKILEIREAYIYDSENIDMPTKSASQGSRISIKEIDWMDMVSTVKNPQKHVILVLYDDDCVEVCRIVERVAKIFEEENEVGFYKMSLDNTGPLLKTLSFLNDPTILWYPKNDKEGFVYSGELTLGHLVQYINDYAGLSRNSKGELKPEAGRITEIEKIIQENILSILTKHNIDYIIFLIETASKKLPHPKRYANYYLALLKEMKKETEPDLVIFREQNFLNKKLSQSESGNKESDIWIQYLNILSAFVDFASNQLPDSTHTNGSPKPDHASEVDIRHKAELKQDIKWKGIWKPQLRHEEL